MDNNENIEQLEDTILTVKVKRVFSEETRAKMSVSRKGRKPANTGKKHSEEAKAKMSAVKKGKSPHNKGSASSLETRKKLSCVNRGIELEAFDDFTTEQSKQERVKFDDSGISKECLKKANFTCDICSLHGVCLHSHHLNSWKFFPEQRLDIDNLVCLCKACHKKFHSIYGNGKTNPNTKEQFEEFKETNKKSAAKEE